ncbi:MAG: HD domain-containing protein [Candidatus Bipolaricaulia bacterium]
MKNKDLANFAKFIFELGQLKRTPRSGWLKLGVNNPESVAAHTFRTAIIGYLLGQLEGENPYKVAGYCLFHDMAETRTMDLDWLAQKYLDKEDYTSSEIVANQIARLPEDLASSIDDLMNRCPESEGLKKVTKDADLLDLIFQSLEIVHQGNPLARKWFYNTLPRLETESGKRIGGFLKDKEQQGELEKLITWWEGARVNSDQDN